MWLPHLQIRKICIYVCALCCAVRCCERDIRAITAIQCAYVYQYAYLYTFYNHQPPSCLTSRLFEGKKAWFLADMLMFCSSNSYSNSNSTTSRSTNQANVLERCFGWFSARDDVLALFLALVWRSHVIWPNNRRFFDCITFALCTNWIALSGCLCAGWHFV